MKVTSFVVGLGIGAAIAVLFAPGSGDQTRQILSEQANRGRRYAKDRARDLRDAGKDLVDSGREVVNRQKDSVSAAAHAAADALRHESQT